MTRRCARGAIATALGTVTRVALAVALVVAAGGTAHAEPIAIMVLPAEAGDARPVDAQVNAAITRGARKVSPHVTTGSASLADTAFMAGCEPAAPACLDAVSDQLGVQQLVIVGTRLHGGQVMVDVTASRRGAAPARRTFAIGADPAPALAEIEATVPKLIGGPPSKDPDDEAQAGGARGDRGPFHGGAATSVRTSRPALVLAIAGGGLLVAGFTLWGLATLTQYDIDDAPTATPSDLRRLEELEDRGDTYASVGNGLVIGGVITAAAGVTWLLYDRRQQRQRSLRFLPTAGPRGAGLALEASW